MARVVIGIVGYYPFIRGYPLGPELMARLQAEPWPADVDLREMNWGPIAIVQDFQASAVQYDRAVLIGAVDRGLAPGTVSSWRWTGGALDPFATQRRVFEAVTGVISLDNLLVIGSHFGIWPRQLYTVELQWTEERLSEFVLDEIEADRADGQAAVIGERPLTPDNERIVDRIAQLARQAALKDAHALSGLPPLSPQRLTSVAAVSHHQAVDERWDSGQAGWQERSR